jgi:chromatin segregation and condensation protein Rec8/ScpA/Scc1 (kleisin family)
MVREGELELRQSEAFAPIFLRRLDDSGRDDKRADDGERDGKDGSARD